MTAIRKQEPQIGNLARDYEWRRSDAGGRVLHQRGSDEEIEGEEEQAED